MKSSSPRNNGDDNSSEIVINEINIKDIKSEIGADSLNRNALRKNTNIEKLVPKVKDFHQIDMDSKNLKDIDDTKNIQDIKESGKIIKKVVKENSTISTMDNQNKNSISNISTNEIWAMLHGGRSMDNDDFDYPLSYEVDYTVKLPPEIDELGL